MCAKVAQNHETNEQKAKNPQKFLSHNLTLLRCPSCAPFLLFVEVRNKQTLTCDQKEATVKQLVLLCLETA